MFQILCIRKKETVSYIQYVYDLHIVDQKKGNCIILTACKYFRSYVSEREKLCHAYSMLMIQTMFIRMRETASYQQYIYVLQFVYQEGETASYLLYVYALDYVYQKGETVSQLLYVYVLDFVYQKEEDCIIPTICL